MTRKEALGLVALGLALPCAASAAPPGGPAPPATFFPDQPRPPHCPSRAQPAPHPVPRGAEASLQGITGCPFTGVTPELFGSVATFLRSASQNQPLVLILDDLHWIDSASKDVLVHLIQSIETVPLLWILVSRETEGASHGCLYLESVDRSHIQYPEVSKPGTFPFYASRPRTRRRCRYEMNIRVNQIKADTHDAILPNKTVREANVIWTSRRPGCTSKPTNP